MNTEEEHEKKATALLKKFLSENRESFDKKLDNMLIHKLLFDGLYNPSGVEINTLKLTGGSFVGHNNN